MFLKIVKCMLLLQIISVICMSNLFSQGYVKTGKKWRPSEMPVIYYIDTSGLPPGSVIAIQNAFNTWQQASNSFFKASLGTPLLSHAQNFLVGPSVLADHYNIIRIEQPGVNISDLAEIFPKAYYGNNRFEEVDIAITSNPNRQFSADPNSCPPQHFDIQTIITHEVGHFLGLDNSNDPNTVMFYNRIPTMGSISKRTLTQSDIDGVIDIYKYIEVPYDCSTISSALSYALPGQIVVVPSTYTVSSSITVPAGKTLQIEPGAVVNFNGNLIIDGSLVAKGTLNLNSGLVINGSLSTNGATLNFANGTTLTSYGKLDCSNTTFTGSNWKGIYLNGSGSNGSRFYGCTISQIFNYGGSTISFTNNSGSNVSYCTISNIDGIGINGIYASNSSLNIGKNKIQNCLNAGVEAYNSSSIYFGGTEIYSSSSSGNNVITGNNKNVAVCNWSTIDMGGSSSRYNNISNSGGVPTIIGVITNHSLLEYTETYLGQPNTWSFDKDAISQIIAGSTLSSPPGPPFKLGVVEEDNSNVTTSELKKVAFSSVSSDANELLKKARELQFNGNYYEALGIYKSILSFTKDTFYVSQSLTGIRFVYGATEDKGILEYVKEYSKGEKSPYVKIAYANMLVISDNFDEAVLEYEKVAKNNPNTCYEIVSLVSQAHLYYFWKHDEKKANEILDYLEKVAPDDIGFRNIRSSVPRKDGNNNKEYFSSEEIEETKVKIAGYSLANYPNPFNPTTNIQFTIPKDEHVKLIVYDITGKVVKELVNGHKSAGTYNIEFNAINHASGTYYYKLEAGEYNIIKKMMLVK